MALKTPKEIRRQIIIEMQTGKYFKAARLPRETVLAEEFGISRNHLITAYNTRVAHSIAL